jgi:hypothetical protein
MNQGQAQANEVAFLKKRLQEEIDNFRKKRSGSRTTAFQIKMTTVTLGALATVALGIKNYFPPRCDSWFSAIALCLTAAIPILAAWEAFFDHR